MTWKRTAKVEHKLFDLQTATPGDHASKFEIQPSWDGKYVAIGVSLGRAGYSIRVVDIATSALVSDSLPRTFDGDASWSDSNRCQGSKLIPMFSARLP
jgi:hypothetical protein